MDKPAISVIVPVYNRPDLVVDTIRSVQAQSLADWELIIVDDHSTDETPEVVGQLARQDARIRFYRRQSDVKGPSVCRNEGVGYATSGLIIFLDSDDLLAPDCLKNRVNYMRDHGGELDFAVFQTEVFQKTPGDSGLCFNCLSYEDDIAHFLLKDACWITTGPLWRREALLRIGGWNEQIFGHDDWELSMRALIKGLRYRKVDVVDAYFRVENVSRGSLSGSSMAPDRIQNSLLADELIFDLLMGVEKERDCKALMRYAAFIRCFDLCSAHHQKLYISNVLRLYRRGILCFSDVAVAVRVALMAAIMDRFSAATDRLVWGRFQSERACLGQTWQYKWVCRNEVNKYVN